VFDWKRKEHIFNQNINREISKKIIGYFIEKRLSFHAFYPVPKNHKHWYFRGDKKCEEFERYFEFNNAHATEITAGKIPESELCQFLIIIPEDRKKFEQFKTEVELLSPGIRVIRTSSPISKGYIWIEVFHQSVSKGNGVKYICDLLDIEHGLTLGIGNDYNDFDLLDFTAYSYMTENAPYEISALYEQAPSNEDDAFALVTRMIF
jgi:hydroxymethylpyrimidine pyrophosphatase-like HAD family hydrolase